MYSLNTFPYVKAFLFSTFTCLIFTKPNQMTNNKYKTKNLYWHTPHRFTLIFRYFKLSILSPMSCLICNYLRSIRFLVVVLREYTLKVHVLVSSEHTLSRVIYVLITQISSIITVARLLDRSDKKLQHGFYSRTFNNI